MKFRLKGFNQPGICTVVDDGSGFLSINGGFYEINELGTFVLRGISDGQAMDEVIDHIREVYAVSDQEARSDADDFVKAMEALGLVLDEDRRRKDVIA